MKILGIDSSATAASAAVVIDSAVAAEFTQNSGHTHSQTLLPMVEQVLHCASLTVDDIDLFAVSSGPGSFTGVRIGISLAKGLAFGRNKPIAAVSTLEALAYNLSGYDGIVCPVMDARRNQVYTAVFENGIRLMPDSLISLDELKNKLSEFDKPVFFTGDGYALAQSTIELPNVRKTPAHLILQNAVSVAVTAQINYYKNKGIFTDVSVQPVYLRASQAERERNERMK